MDILDILLDILLKPPQPFIGLFFSQNPTFQNPHVFFHKTLHFISETLKSE